MSFLVEQALLPLAKLLPSRIVDACWQVFLLLLVALRIGRWRSVSSSTYDGKRRELWRAAETRGVVFERLFLLGQPTSTHRADINGRWMIVEEWLPIAEGGTPFHPAINDKSAMRRILQSAHIPVPEGKTFWRTHPAARYANELGVCVIKSRDGSLSKHVMIQPEDPSRAVAIVKEVCPSVIVEQYVEGDVFRATTVHGKFVAATRRVPRAPREKVVMADGARMVDVTDDVHPKNRELFEHAAEVVGGAILGIDFITRDPARPWDEGALFVIELNSFPNFEMHHHPDEGESRDVAGAYWDSLM